MLVWICVDSRPFTRRIVVSSGKTAYICGPLTELLDWQISSTKAFYAQIAEAYKRVTGVRAFVPHEHCDPQMHSNLSCAEVDAIEREQVQKKTNILVVVAIAPSWGGGIEVEMAHQANVPVIVIHRYDKKISRLLRGNPAVKCVFSYEHTGHAICFLERKFKELCVSPTQSSQPQVANTTT